MVELTPKYNESISRSDISPGSGVRLCGTHQESQLLKRLEQEDSIQVQLRQNSQILPQSQTSEYLA